MRKKNLPKTKTSKVRRQRDPIPWKYCLLTLVCGLLLVAGFFYAARSHFSSMDYAMKNAELRKQIEELKSETRRLKLSREIALSPAEIKKAAKNLGLTTMTVKNIEVVEIKSVEKASETSYKETDIADNSKSNAKIDKKGNRKTGKKSEKKEESELNNKKREKKENTEILRKDGSFKTQVAKR